MNELSSKELTNVIKYNFYRTLYKGNITIDTSHLRKNLKGDFEKRGITYCDDDINDVIDYLLRKYRYDIIGEMF